MMKTLLAVILISLPMLAADPAWDTAAVKAACGANDATFKANPSGRRPAAQPEAGKALVYVVEPYGRLNTLGAPTIRVGLDGSWAGANHGASYVFFSVGPGEHHLCADWQLAHYTQPSLVHLAAEAGQTYYFSTLITAHPGFYTVEFEPVSSDEGQLLVETSGLSDYHRKK